MIQHSQETYEYRDMLRENGYLKLGLPISGADIDPLFDQFRDFSELAWADDESGKELIEAMNYSIDARPDDADYFLVHRRVGEPNMFSARSTIGTENKDVAHIGPRSRELAHARLGKRMPAVMSQFLDSCVELHEAVKTTVRPVYKALGMEHIMLAENPSDDIHMVRVLRYLGTSATHKADLHFDRSVSTFAAWESSPGLVGTPGNNAFGNSSLSVRELDTMASRANTSPINHVTNEGKFFLGAGYNRLPQNIHEQNGTLPLLAHGVVNVESDAERDAVVVFMNPRIGFEPYTVPSKEETGWDELAKHLETAA